MTPPPLPQDNISIRLATTPEDVRAAQALRYKVFYEEQGAKADPEMAATKLDIDQFDQFADHLIVIDNDLPATEDRVVGTYRLLRHDHASRAGRFYTADEYDIGPLLHSGARLLELGRSCVLPPYRTMPVMQMLWSEIARYVADYKLDLLFGCASFHGTDPHKIAKELAFLYHYHLAPSELRPRARSGRYVDMNLMGRDSLEARRVFAQLPPLLKGYLRVGATIGDGAVIDEQFNTIDVCVVLPTHLVTDKYLQHYQRGLDKPILSDSPFTENYRHLTTRRDN